MIPFNDLLTFAFKLSRQSRPVQEEVRRGLTEAGRLGEAFNPLQQNFEAPLNCTIERLLNSAADSRAVRDILEKWALVGISPVSIFCPCYPVELRRIADPPWILFVKGRHDAAALSKPKVAIVGARRATMRGIQHARILGTELAAQGVAVVSGLALGIDGAAHEGAIKSGESASTIAVLAHGLDSVYPASHRHLAEQILLNGGVLVSEYEPGVRARQHHFLVRNRIVAGLSQAVVVVQAEARSGALCTARLALESGREVLAAPGYYDDVSYQGCLGLIRQGAGLALTSADVLDSVSGLRASCRPLRSSTTLQTVPSRFSDLVAVIKQHSPIDYDDLRRVVVDTAGLDEALFELEALGVLTRNLSDQYVI